MIVVSMVRYKYLSTAITISTFNLTASLYIFYSNINYCNLNYPIKGLAYEVLQ